MVLQEARKLFSHLAKELIYFNHASLGPLSERVTARIHEFTEQRSTGSIDNFPQFIKSSLSAKTQLGKMLNCPVDRISWIDNVSNALNTLANGINLKKGDRIILFENEFPSNVYPFLNLRKNGVEIDMIKTNGHRILIEDIEKTITRDTKLLSISLVQFLSGFRADLESIGELCSQNEIIFAIDAIQGAGVVNIDIEKMKIDFLAGGSQKWLMALQGTSYFYVSEKLQDKMIQPYMGWTSVSDAWSLTSYDMELKKSADSFQNGTLNSIGITALDESLKLFHEFGLVNIEKRILDNTEYLRKRLIESGIQLMLNDVDRKQLSGITTIKVPEIEKVYAELQKNNITCSMREGYIRFAPHFYNTREEIDKVIDSINTTVSDL